MLPHDHDLPPGSGKPPDVVFVATDILCQFLRPPITVSRGWSAVLLTSMPPAAMDVDGYAGLGKDQIRPTTKIGQGLSVDVVAKSSSVDGPTDSNLRCGVANSLLPHLTTHDF
jgi:hypothetical protein